MTTNEELALVKRVKNGDKEALSKLWDNINPKLYGYLVNVLKDKERADDILQSTWLKAIDKMDKFKDRGVRFSAWLFAVSRNECKQFWRQNKTSQPTSLEGLEANLSVRTENKIADKLMVEDIFKKLTLDEQEIIRLRFIGQLDFKEIAKILEISVILARVRLHRVLKKARVIVG